MTDPSGPQFVISGYRSGTSPYDQGTYGFYWSSSAYTSATSAYSLHLNGTNSTVNPANSGYERAGFPLRCLDQDRIVFRYALGTDFAEDLAREWLDDEKLAEQGEGEIEDNCLEPHRNHCGEEIS